MKFCEKKGLVHRIAHILGIANPRICMNEIGKFVPVVKSE